MTKQKLLSKIPSVDELIKSPQGEKWLKHHPRRLVLKAVRTILDAIREEILTKGLTGEPSTEWIFSGIEAEIKRLAAYRLKPLINATGVVIHTNLGRSVLSDMAKENMVRVAGSYSNLEYELSQGKRGKRYSHIRDIIVELTGAEDALVVNNNAAAVLICLNTLARDMEVVVSRGELVEIGGSFRIPEIMRSSGAMLREVGTTNKTHLSDYENALSGNTALLLKVHQSNYKLKGFTEEVPLDALVKLGGTYRIPVMTDLGSGCMIDLRRFGIHDEPSVREVVRSGTDVVTFSGDKLLGGPQCGIILGKKKFMQKVHKNSLLRTVRVDKLTLAALETTFAQYLDEDRACKDIPTLNMLTQPLANIKRRAGRIASALKKKGAGLADVEIASDRSRAGGGSLPEADFPTFVVSVRPRHISLNALEKKLRDADPPVIARIRADSLLVDARTVRDREVRTLINCIISALS